jgi:hypothetical protein
LTACIAVAVVCNDAECTCRDMHSQRMQGVLQTLKTTFAAQAAQLTTLQAEHNKVAAAASRHHNPSRAAKGRAAASSEVCTGLHA